MTVSVCTGQGTQGVQGVHGPQGTQSTQAGQGAVAAQGAPGKQDTRSTGRAGTPAAGATRFSRRRFALLVFAGVYPLVTGLLYLVFPLTEGWTLWQRTLAIVPVVVVVMVWWLIPAVQQRFRAFLNPAVR